jgi:hypothetical protein
MLLLLRPPAVGNVSVDLRQFLALLPSKAHLHLKVVDVNLFG